MQILLLGASHRDAPVALRERLAYSASELRAALTALHRTEPPYPLAGSELVILSTCNRTELYLALPAVPARGHAACAEPPWDALIDFLARTRDLAPETFVPYIYRRTGVDVVRHACHVAAGLDSMVLGEAEVLGQVGAARGAAQEHGTLGPTLTAVFLRAIRAGRRARAETGICRNAASVSSEVVALIAEKLGSLAGRRILIMGSGHMARRAGEALRERGATDLCVVSRNLAHSGHLASELGASAVAWSDLEATLRQSDIVLCATSAPHVVIEKALVERACAERAPGLPLLLVDTAVPRDVEPEVRDLPGVRLFDIDDLGRRLQGNLSLRELEGPQVEKIIDEEVRTFEEWQRGTSLRPLLTALRQRAEAIRRSELERLLRRMPDLPHDARQQVEYLSHALVNKLLHEPTVRLRAESDPERLGAYARIAGHLFGVAEAPVDAVDREGHR